MKTIIIAPHPDDEVLGAGGTLLKKKDEGNSVGWLIVTGASVKDGWSKEFINKRNSEINKVAKLFGFCDIFKLNLPPTQLDTIPISSLISSISDVFKSFEPTEVLVPHRGDVHSDHRIIFDAVVACVKCFRYPEIQKVMSYETPSETEFGLSNEKNFRPNVYVDISKYLNKKTEIMKIYSSEIGDFPFSRSIEAIKSLAKWRGANSGFGAAEAFDLLLERS